MLKNLYIKNFAIIDQLDLELKSGMTSLTGETGAGKSILLGALGLVLGERADNNKIKSPADFAEIVAEFNISQLDDVSSWLVAKELNTDDECILRRKITKDGSSRAYINSTPVNLKTIRELAEMLIDIHGQHEHQSIMKRPVQRQLLDDYANHRRLLKTVSNLYVELKLVEEQLAHLQQNNKQKNDRVDLLQFQTQELDALALQTDEYETLERQHKRLANVEQLRQSISLAIYQLSEDENSNIQSTLAQIINKLSELGEIDDKLKPATLLLQDSLIQIEESLSQLQNYQDEIDTDTSALAQTEQRLEVILDLARKHQVKPGELVRLHQGFKNELDNISLADDQLEQLRANHQSLLEKYIEAAEKLSASRHKSAQQLNQKISLAMQTLGMSGGEFEILLMKAKDKYSAYGIDIIEFTVSANAGNPCQPLAKVASGGELARISLAIQMIIANTSKISTLIFDEVDSGIGGSIAEIVGQHLRQLGQTNQIICITHLAQVASQAHQHLRVEKQQSGQQTTSAVLTLNHEQRRQEIARMLSGVDITEQSLAHADEMIERAHNH